MIATSPPWEPLSTKFGYSHFMFWTIKGPDKTNFDKIVIKLAEIHGNKFFLRLLDVNFHAFSENINLEPFTMYAGLKMIKMFSVK